MSEAESDRDSRDPEPPLRALRRIAHEANEIQRSLEQRDRERAARALAGIPRPWDRADLTADECVRQLSVLVAELAGIVATIEER